MIDLHVHTTASDGRLTPFALVDAARGAGLTIISITDHDTTAGYQSARAHAAGAGLELVPGVEISAVSGGRDVHVLGYFLDAASPSLHAFLDRQRADRLRRVAEMSDRLARLGCPIDAGPVLAAAKTGRSVGRPQIAEALVSAGHVRTRSEAFDRFLEYGGAAYVPRQGASPEEVVGIIHAAGGLASLAHPGVTDRDAVIDRMVEAGLDAIEVRHADHDAATESRYRRLAGERGLLVTGGSDFHGTDEHRVSSLGLVTLPEEDYRAFRAASADHPGV